MVDIYGHHPQWSEIRVLKLRIYLIEKIRLVEETCPCVTEFLIGLVLPVDFIRESSLLLEQADRGKDPASYYPLRIWPGDKVESSQVKCLFDILRVVIRRDHDDRNIICHVFLLHLCQDPETVEFARHDQIQENYIYLLELLPDDLHPLITVPGLQDIHFVYKDIPQLRSVQRCIIDNEYAFPSAVR